MENQETTNQSQSSMNQASQLGSPASNRSKVIISWVMTITISLLLLVTAGAKIAGAEQVLLQFEKFGLLNYVIVIGVLEAICTILFIIPKTSSVGTLLLSAYLGGAIVAELIAGGLFVFPFFVLIIIWVTAFVRSPEFFEKLVK